MTNQARSQGANKPIIWLLAMLIVGGLGWLLWPSDASETEHASATDRDTADRPIETQPKPKRRDLTREAKASVSGFVRTFGGTPLADAQVCATPVRGQLRGLGDSKPKCVRTGQDGHYRVEDLWPVRTQFSASAAAHEPRGWRMKDERGRWRDYATLVPGGETKGVDFELKAGGVKLSGVVKDLGGGEIEGAMVEAGRGSRFGASRATTVAFSDAEGRFELWVAAGRSRVSASAEGYGSTGTQVFAPSERVELFLTPESVLVGQVVHAETGEPVPDVAVSASSGGPFGGFDGEQVRTDSEGQFRIAGLFPGVYKPTATNDHFYGQASMQVHLGLGQTSEPVEIRVHPMALIEGRVVIASSTEGCESGSVALTSTNQTDRFRAATDDEGHVALRGVLPGEYQVEVSCAGQVASDDYPNLTIASADLLDQVWEVREGQAIRGLVLDSEGRPVSEASVSARMVVDASNARDQTTSARAGECEEDGSFELAGLLAGRYEITVRSEIPAPDAPLIVDLPAGSDRNDVRIELLATGTITGRVIDEHGTPQPGANVRARALGKRDQASSTTDDQGNFVIEHARTGEVRVQASTDGWGSTMRAPGSSDDDLQGEQVEVIAGQTIDVELRVESRTGVIRGTVLDEHGGPVDDAFIQAERLSDSATANAAQSVGAVRWGGGGSQPILSDVDGSFTIDELAPGNYVVRAHRRGGGEAIAESVPVGGTIELTIASTGVLAGKVVVEGGEPPEKFHVRVFDRAQSLGFDDEFFRTEGQWQISELPAGKYEVSVDSNAGTTTLEVELEAGGRVEDLELVLQPRVTYRGRLIDIDTREPVPGMEVIIGSQAGGFGGGAQGERKQISDAEGRFEVEHAPTGSVNVVVMPRSRGNSSSYEMAFFAREIATEPAIQDGGDLELVERRLDPEQVAGDLGFELERSEPGIEPDEVVLRVGLIRPGGPAAATALAVGDVIETVDGKSVTGADSRRYRQLTNVPPGTVLELGLAEGKSVTITAEAPIK